MKYSSMIDGLYIVVIILVGIVGIILSDLLFILGFWYISLFIIAIFSLLYWMFFGTSITLHDDKMQIKLAFFKKNIKYADIKEIKKTKNSLSSFATSRRRIGVRTSDKTGIFNYTYISPKDEQEFLVKLRTKLGENVIFTGVD